MSSSSYNAKMFRYYMEKCYVLPKEIKNDIVYCQRAMRDFLKVHGLVSDVFKEQADADPVQMQRILDELEEEVFEINAEQQFLMLKLNEHLDSFYKKLEENGIVCEPELGNTLVSGLLVPLIADANYKIQPVSVMLRDTEEVLIRKHFLVAQDEENGVPGSPLKLSDLDENIPLMLYNNEDDAVASSTSTAAAATPAAAAAAFVGAPPKRGDQVPPLTAAKKCSSSVAVMIVPDSVLKVNRTQTTPQKKQELPRSLLIPRGESDSSLQLFGGEADSRAESYKQQRLVKPVRASLTSSPPPLTPIGKPQAAGAAAPPAPASDSADFEYVAQSRMNLRKALKRARKTKQQPRHFDDEEDAIEMPSLTEMPRKAKNQEAEAAAVLPAPGRALEGPKNKMPKLMAQAEAAVTASAGVLSKKAFQQQQAQQQQQGKQYKTRNAQGARKGGEGGAISPPPLLASSSSDDSNQEQQEFKPQQQQRLWSDEPRETRILPGDYGQEQFLGLFGLYTPDVLKKLSQRHSKRKRRTVQNASGIDFHYGQQLAATDAAATARQKQKQSAKPEFLLSPKQKSLQEKKAAQKLGRKSKSRSPDKAEDQNPPASTANNNHSSSSSSSSGGCGSSLTASAVAAALSAAAESKIKRCKECKKRSDHTLTCDNCQGYYHLYCHDDVVGPVLTKCPSCLAKMRGVSKAL